MTKVRLRDYAVVTAYDDALIAKRDADSALEKAAFAYCRHVVRAVYPDARTVVLAVEDDMGQFLNGIAAICNAEGDRLYGMDDENEELERLPWGDLFDPDEGDYEGRFVVDLEDGA